MMELAQLWVSELYTLHFFFNFSLITVISDLIIVMACKNTHTNITYGKSFQKYFFCNFVKLSKWGAYSLVVNTLKHIATAPLADLASNLDPGSHAPLFNQQFPVNLHCPVI